MNSWAWRLRCVDIEGDDGLVLRGIDLDVPAAGIVTVVGRSGAGKSCLLKLLAGVSSAASGTIELSVDPRRVAWHDQAWRSQRGELRLREIEQLEVQSGGALLLDEPDKGLDEVWITRIRRYLATLIDSDVTVVVVTHDHGWVRMQSTTTVVVSGGTASMQNVAQIDFLEMQHATMERLRQG
jgi:ABC-type sulfate/molybdate transport systems ATPase subunit